MQHNKIKPHRACLLRVGRVKFSYLSAILNSSNPSNASAIPNLTCESMSSGSPLPKKYESPMKPPPASRPFSSANPETLSFRHAGPLSREACLCLLLNSTMLILSGY